MYTHTPHLRQWKFALYTGLLVVLLWSVASVLAIPVITTVDAVGDVGQYSSMEINAAGNPVISYFDANGFDPSLRVAICANPTCTASTLVLLDNTGFQPVGTFTSLELAVAPGGAPVVSYFDQNAGGRLMLVACGDANCGTVSAPVAVDDPADMVGTFTSLALAGNNPVISYYDDFNGDLKLAVCGDPACGAITTMTLDGGGGTNVGQYTSVAVNGANPVISYFDQTNNRLKLVVCANPACGAFIVRDLAPGGQFTSVALTATGNPVISYRDGGGLSVVTCADPTCATSTITSVDVGNVGYDSSLTLTAGGCPVISYYDVDNESLKVATYSGANCTLVTVTTLDTGGVGEYSSVQLNAAGFPVISYYDRTNGDLKLITCDTATCAPLPIYTSTPARTGSTIVLTGATGSTVNSNIAVTNTGAAGSELDADIISITPGYTVTGLPIVDQTVGAAAINLVVTCTIPTGPGTLIVETNEPGNPQYTYNLTCAAPVVATPTTAPSTSGGGGGASQSSIIVFDPAISKIGFLVPGQTGVRGEKIEWMVTVTNNGTDVGQNIIVTDTLNSGLRIDRVSAPGGSVTITGQTVSVTYATLASAQSVQFSIFTTVLNGVEVENTACMSATNLTGERCSTGRVVTALPATGETPGWSMVLRSSVFVLFGTLILVGIWSYFLHRSTEPS